MTLIDGGWTQGANIFDGGATTYEVYTKGNARLLIEDGVAVAGPPPISVIALSALDGSNGFLARHRRQRPGDDVRPSRQRSRNVPLSPLVGRHVEPNAGRAEPIEETSIARLVDPASHRLGQDGTYLRCTLQLLL